MDSVTKLINYASIITGVLLGAGTGYVIYNRVVKRAAEIETEEHASNSSANLTLARAMGSRYSERSLATLADDEENNNVAQDEATCKDTTNASAHHTYSDDLSDDETNVFAQGDGDEEQS